MKWVLVPLLLLMAMTVAAEDSYQRGYQMGADAKAFRDGWEAAQSEPRPNKPAQQQSDNYAPLAPAPEQQNAAWKATFITEKGSRTDYIPQNDGFAVDKDSMSSKFEFTVNPGTPMASIRMSGGHIKKPENYEAVVLQSGEDMIVLCTTYGATQHIDKFEVYTLYPKSGIGFMTITSAYAGDFIIKAAAENDKSVPSASSTTFPLRMTE